MSRQPSRAFRALLWLYPTEFRDEYGRELTLVFADRYRSASSLPALVLVWLEAIAGVLFEAPKEHGRMIVQDVRYALRTLRKTPSFSVTALLTLALAIGATTVIFGLFHAVLLRPLPYVEPERVVRVWSTNQKLGMTAFSSSVRDFVSFRERSRSFESLAGFRDASVNLTGDSEPERAAGIAASAEFLRTLGLHPLAGRGFLAEEDRLGRDQVVLISEGLWRRRYGADPSLVGRTIAVDSVPRTVVGILRQDAGFASAIDIWLPLAPNLEQENRGDHQIFVAGRLKPGVSLAQAESDLSQVAAQLEREYPQTNQGWGVRLEPALDWIVGREVRTSLWALFAAAALLLLVACANVASLLLARASARQQEMGVRLALGASRTRLLRQLLTESLLLATLGGGLGLLLAFAGTEGLKKLLPAETPRLEGLAMGSPVLLFAAALTVATALLFGLAPAWLASRSALDATLRRSGRNASGWGALRQGLVVGQLALATVLVIGTGLLVQSLERIERVALGFHPDHLLTARISLPEARYPTMEKASVFYRELLAGVQALPGVTEAGITSGLPMDGGDTQMSVTPLDRLPGVPEQGIQSSWRIVTSGYLQTLRVPLRKGHLFVEGEEGSLKPIILSEGLARRLWPDGSDAQGRRVRLANQQVFTVAGVVGDVRLNGLAEEPPPTMYLPPTWYLWPTMNLVVRSPLETSAVAAALRQTVARIDPAQPLFAIRTLDEVVASNAARPRLHTGLMASFALLALVLGAVGVFGVVSYAVARRTPELALRLALGASPGQVVRELMRTGVWLCGLGLLLGTGGALLLGRFLSSLLYQVRPDDPFTFAAVGTTLLLVTLLASWLPARRAVRIDPAAALRSE